LLGRIGTIDIQAEKDKDNSANKLNPKKLLLNKGYNK
jgi:hypothetical protein